MMGMWCSARVECVVRWAYLPRVETMEIDRAGPGAGATRYISRSIVSWPLLGAIFAAAIAIDLLAPWPYVMTPLYAPGILVAAWFQTWRQTVAVAILANLINIVSAVIQGTPREIWFLYSSGLIIIGILAVHIAAQRQQLVQRAEALRASEEQFRSIVTSLKDYAIFTLDRRGNVTTWNDGAERIKGYRADEVIGRHSSCFYPVEDARAGRAEENLARAARDGRCDDEGWRVRKDGSRFWAISTIFPLRGPPDAPRGFVKITRDMTERKQAEEERSRLYAAELAARRSAELARQRQAFLAEASIVLGSTLEYEATLGVVARMAIPTLADWCIVYIAGDDGTFRRLMVAHADPSVEAALHTYTDRFPISSAAASNLQRILRSGESVLNPEISDEGIAAFAGGQEYTDYLRRIGLRSAMVVPLATHGQVLGAVLLAYTRADGRYSTHDLALAEDLARRMALAIENARLYQQAREAVLARDIVLASVSHDLRQPLTIIQGYVGIAIQHLSATQDGGTAVLPELERISRAARRMDSMAQIMVDTARLLMGHRLEIECHPTDLVELVKEATEEESVRLADKTSLRLDMDVAELTGQWDSGRIRRVVGNLIGNAIKYSPSGGEVAVRVRREEDAEGAWAVVEVRDQGIGIPAADLPHVFERFHRGANAIGSITGAGIGLATARRIVEQHRGSISVSSQEGSGSTFRVRLPISPPSVDPSGGEPAGARPTEDQ